MRYTKTLFSLILSTLLLACQSNSSLVHQLQNPDTLYVDEQFNTAYLPAIETEHEVFMLDEEMIQMVEDKINPMQSTSKKARRLLEHIFSQDNIALSYSSNANVTARDAYHNQTANCMSLTIMAYALAKEAGLKVDFQDVDVPEYWVRNGKYNVLTGHVNLVIKPYFNYDRNIIYGSDAIKVDFDPYINKQSFPKKVIQKNTVLAMFYNNKGGQALVSAEYDLAYQYLKASTQTDPTFSPAWGNLAVLYKLTGHQAIAENTYRHAIDLSSDNLTALANLAILLRDNQQIEEAKSIERSLIAKRNKNPYYHAVLADEAYHRDDYHTAIKHYKKALKLNDSVHEAYFGLAKVYYKLDNIPATKKMLNKAIRANKTRSIDYQYIAKLNFLNAKQVY